jgi:hypothetical protein
MRTKTTTKATSSLKNETLFSYSREREREGTSTTNYRAKERERERAKKVVRYTIMESSLRKFFENFEFFVI